MTACEYSAMITGIACMLAKDKGVEELKLLAAMFYQLGRTLETMAIYTDVCIIDEEEETITKEMTSTKETTSKCKTTKEKIIKEKTTKEKTTKEKIMKERASKEKESGEEHPEDEIAEDETIEEETTEEETTEEEVLEGETSEDRRMYEEVTDASSGGLSSIGFPNNL